MRLIAGILLISYLLITLHFLVNWLKFSRRKPMSSLEDRFLSLIILVIVVIGWPLMVPISIMQGRSKIEELQLGNIMPVAIGIFAASLLTISGVVAFAAVMH